MPVDLGVQDYVSRILQKDTSNFGHTMTLKVFLPEAADCWLEATLDGGGMLRAACCMLHAAYRKMHAY